MRDYPFKYLSPVEKTTNGAAERENPGESVQVL
jgi:hypothetical protein